MNTNPKAFEFQAAMNPMSLILLFSDGVKHFIRSQMKCFLLGSYAALIVHSEVRYILFSKWGRLWESTYFFFK